MYLHIGRDFILRKRDIIGLFDMDNTTGSKRTREFLAAAEKAGGIVNAAEDIPRSFVVTADGEKQGVYLSQFNTATLVKRA